MARPLIGQLPRLWSHCGRRLRDLRQTQRSHLTRSASLTRMNLTAWTQGYAEDLTRNEQVKGSIPLGGSTSHLLFPSEWDVGLLLGSYGRCSITAALRSKRPPWSRWHGNRTPCDGRARLAGNDDRHALGGEPQHRARAAMWRPDRWTAKPFI